jgi:hypothetical protein
MKRKLHLLSLLLLAAAIIQTSSAQRTIRMNIERIIADAAIIVHGTVTEVHSAIDPKTNLLSTFVTIDVKENLFGADQKKITVKMLGGKTDRRTLKLADMPQYVKGQEIVGCFFLPSKSGFTSPVGMGQGTFTIVTEPSSGKRMVRSAAEHRQLFAGMKYSSALARKEWQSGTAQEIDAAEFTRTIRTLITELKK